MNEQVGKLTLRDNFEFDVYVTKTLQLSAQNRLSHKKYINQTNSFPGRLIKNGDEVTLELSKICGVDDIIVPFSMDDEKLYAVTWEGDIFFVINSCDYIDEEKKFCYDSLSNCVIEKYSVNNMFIAHQIELYDNISQARFAFDYVNEWLSLYDSKMTRLQLQETKIVLPSVNYRGVELSLIVRPIIKNKANVKELVHSVDSDFLITFRSQQSKEFVYSLGIHLRNFFQFLLNHKLGLYKILLNSPNFDENDYQPRNWYVAHSFLPKIDKNISTDFTYENIRGEFKNILKTFLEDTRIQDFVKRILLAEQDNIPVTTSLIVLSSAIETYLNETICLPNLEGSHGFLEKVNYIFYNEWTVKETISKTPDIILANRNFYVHGKLDDPEKQKLVLSEVELEPIVHEFQKAIHLFLKRQLNIPTTSGYNPLDI